MVRRIRWSAVLVPVLIVALAGVALAVVNYGTRSKISTGYAYNYSNSMDYTGTPGTSNFRLQEAYVTDANNPAVVKVARSATGAGGSWTTKKVSGSKSAEGSSLAAAGSTIIVGWMTGYSYYDADGAPRVFQANVSTNAGGTWNGVKNLTPGKGKVDYPIVAAAQVGGTTNVYGAWINSANGKVLFRMSSNGGGTWSTPIALGSTTATQSGAAYGYSGFANIAAVGDLISVVWIAKNDGTMKVRSINAGGVAAAPATVTNWNKPVTLTDKISTAQNGYPIASASPLQTGVVTIAYNTATAQKYTTFTGGSSSAAAAGKLIFTNGGVGGVTYTGGYSTMVEPAPGGGFVAMWAGCRGTVSCDYNSNKAKFDLLTRSSADGTTWGTTTRIETTAASQQLNDEPSLVVIPDASGVKVYAQYNAYKPSYTYYDVWMKIGTGPLAG